MGKPSPLRYLRTETGSTTKAMIFIFPEHAGQTETSIWNTRASRTDHANLYLVDPVFCLSTEGVFPVFSAGTILARRLE